MVTLIELLFWDRLKSTTVRGNERWIPTYRSSTNLPTYATYHFCLSC